MTEFGRKMTEEALRLRGHAVLEDRKDKKFYLIELATNHRLPQRFDTWYEAVAYFNIHIGGV